MVPLLHADTETDRPYYVMPYLRGGSLSRYAGNLSDIQLHSIAKELALILAGLHAAYVEHGDVKPDNVLASDDGHLQVADPWAMELAAQSCFRRITAARRDIGLRRFVPEARFHKLATSIRMAQRFTNYQPVGSRRTVSGSI